MKLYGVAGMSLSVFAIYSMQPERIIQWDQMVITDSGQFDQSNLQAPQVQVLQVKKPHRQKKIFFRAHAAAPVSAVFQEADPWVYQDMIRVNVASLIVKHFGDSKNMSPLPNFTGADYALPLIPKYIAAARAYYAADSRIKGYCDEIGLHSNELFDGNSFVQPVLITKELQVPLQEFASHYPESQITCWVCRLNLLHIRGNASCPS